MKSLLTLSLALVASAARVPRHATVVSRQAAIEKQYDFVIAGAGISGLTVADRLTEDPDVTVLVIETGPFDQDEDSVLVPGAYFPVPYLWIPLPSAPQEALNNRVFNVPLGRAVGGGSVVNAMVFLRSGREEYADWEKLGARGWSWDDLLPYFKKSENFTAPDAEYAAAANISWVDDVHGHGGPVQSSFPNFHFEASGNWWNAALSSGLTPTDDPNGGNAAGLTWFTTSVDYTSRTRSHARLNHYERVSDARPNYHILAEHTVSRVIFKKKRAVGVEFLPTTGGEVSTVIASKEVLLAAGAVHTPQILQLSGIGPTRLLRAHGIDVVADLPGVGQNFQDQPSIIVPYKVTNNIEPNTGTLDADPEYDAEQRALYDTEREGPYVLTRGLSTVLALPPLCNATDSCRTIIEAAERRDADAFLPPDIDETVLAGYKAQRKAIFKQLKGQETPVAMIHWDTADSVRMYFLKPLSRGLVTINTTNPLDNPIIDFRTMTDPVDFDMVLASFLKNRDIMSQPSMQVLGPREAEPFSDDITDADELKRILAGVAEPSSAHECCTAAMMPKKLGGVVDPEMRVYDVKGLRVVDVSFWPMVLTAAPSATAYAAGEKAADMIKRQHCLAAACDGDDDD